MVETYYIKGVQKQPFADVLQNSRSKTRNEHVQTTFQTTFQNKKRTRVFIGIL